MNDIISKILKQTRIDLNERRQQTPLTEVQEKCQELSLPPRDFARSLRQPGVRIIAECKRRSPSRGILVDPYDPVSLARAYEEGGAAAISVLTDEPFFGGSLEHLELLRATVNLPILRKDFIVDVYQIYEARAAGADAVLLLAGILGLQRLKDFLAVCHQLGMEALVESHTASELELALAAKGTVIGVNNRNLATFSVDLDHSKNLLSQINRSETEDQAEIEGKVPSRIAVCESGIKGPSDIENMWAVGYKAFLVGEAVATHSDPSAAVAALVAAVDH